MLQEIDQFASAVLEFDSEKFYLGSLCKRGHDYKGTGKTLRKLPKRHATCIECRKLFVEEHKGELKQYQRDYYQENKDHIREVCKNWVARNWDRKRANDERYKERSGQPRKYYLKNRDKILNRVSEYYKTPTGKLNALKTCYKRRSRKAITKGSYTVEDLNLLRIQFKNTCAYCDKQNPDTWDHVVPLSKGGLDLIENIVPCCRSCNNKKQAQNLSQWYPKQEFFCDENFEKVLTHVKPFLQNLKNPAI